ncbi:MAG: prepilin peptidase [Acidimicrobiaceae bacterium]|nr:prepilin peptidase [Acidimicrobiaceae bacterium]
MTTALIFAASAAGLVAGGLITMSAGRVACGEALSLRSRCGACRASLRHGETIPVLSWLVLRGRCRHCSARIGFMYPVVESSTSALLVAVALRFGWDWRLFPPLVLAVALMALSLVDLYSYRLPDRLVFPALGVSASAILAEAVNRGDRWVLWYALFGMCVYFSFLLVVHLISPRGLGFGDVKLSLLLGLNLGWAAGVAGGDWVDVVRYVFWAQLLAGLIGLVGGILIGVLRRKLERDVLPDPQVVDGQPVGILAQSFPFGPALACSTMAVVLFADSAPAF